MISVTSIAIDGLMKGTRHRLGVIFIMANLTALESQGQVIPWVEGSKECPQVISEAIQQGGLSKKENSDKCGRMNTDLFVQGREDMCMTYA